MKIGINCGPIVKTLGIDEGFYQIAQSGFDCVDLSLTHFLPIAWPYHSPQNRRQTPYETMSEEELLESVRPFKEAAEKYGLSIGQAHAVDPEFINDPETDERLLEILKRTIIACGYLKCRYLIIHPVCCEFEINEFTHKMEWDANMRRFGELIPYLKQYDVIACLENMYTMCRWGEAGSNLRDRAYPAICSNPHEANQYVDALNALAGEKRFAFCLDTGHAFMVGMKLDDVIRTLGNRLEALHLNDNDGKMDWHMMPYTGVLPWEKVLDGLRNIGYQNTLNFELYMNFDKDIMPAAINYVASVGKMFAKRIEQKEEEDYNES